MTAETTLRQLEAEAVADAERLTAEKRLSDPRFTCSGRAMIDLDTNITLWVTAHYGILTHRGRPRKLAYIPGFDYWLEGPNEGMGLTRAEALAFLTNRTGVLA